MSKGQKLILSVGVLVIIIVTICTFFQADIKYEITTRKIEHLYGVTKENNYFKEDSFSYVSNYEDAVLTSKEDIINSVYYTINSGITETEKYCAKDYDDCYQDITDVSNDKELLSTLNNYVHPFNTFETISFDFDMNKVKITIQHIYNDEEIDKVNSVVDSIIEKNINSSMSTKEKIKTIHDYIIDNTDYDKLKADNKEDTTYKSNTAYGVLIQEYGICSGYSDAMAIFLDKLNIINYKISNDQHIWNLVYLDNRWLHLDLTWDDPISDQNITRDNYFLITSKTLEEFNDGVHYFNNDTYPEAK